MQKRGTSLGMDLDDIVFIPVTSGQELFDTDGLFEIIASTPPGRGRGPGHQPDQGGPH